MRNYRAFLREMELRSRPKIAMLMCDDDTHRMMHEWCKEQGFDLTKSYSGRSQPSFEFDFHLTLFASKNPIDIRTGTFEIESITERGYAFEALGKDKDVPVLRFVPAGEIRWIRDVCVEDFGVEPTFPTFKPHVSLSYNWSGKPALSKLRVPDPLTFDRIKIVDFKLDEAMSVDFSVI